VIPKALGFVLIVLLGATLAYGLAQHFRRDDAVLVAARDTMRVIEVRRDTIRDTIKVREKVVAHFDTVVRNTSDTTILVRRDTTTITVTVPVEVVQRDEAKDRLILGYRADRFQDSLWHIQDAKLPHRPPSRLGLSVTAGYGCVKSCGFGVVVGGSYRIR
jgi:hypothetical protein